MACSDRERWDDKRGRFVSETPTHPSPRSGLAIGLLAGAALVLAGSLLYVATRPTTPAAFVPATPPPAAFVSPILVPPPPPAAAVAPPLPPAAAPSPIVIMVNPPSPAPAATRVVRYRVAPKSVRVYRMDCRGHARCVQINHR